MKLYILRDSFEIIGVYNTLNDAFHNWVEILTIYSRYNNNINILLNQIQIFEYDNNLIKNIYTFDKNKLIDSNNEIINFNNNIIEKRLDKLFNNNTYIVESEINLFIPVTETLQINNNPDSKIENIKKSDSISVNELEKKIKMLELLKEKEIEEYNNLENELKEKEEKYIEDKIKMDKITLKLKTEQEKWEAIKKKFEVDKKLYFIFKKEFDNKTRNEIPILFQEIYPVFEFMDTNGILNSIKEFDTYASMTKNFKNSHIQTNLDNIFNQQETFVCDNDSDSSFYCNIDKSH